MSVLAFVPRYRDPHLSADEQAARSIADVLDPEAKLPNTCNRCGAAGCFENPLMMEPLRRFDNGLPQGTLYQAICARCKEIKAMRR